mgnify:CR=1 FL=1
MTMCLLTFIGAFTGFIAADFPPLRSTGKKQSWIMTTAEQNMSWNFTAVTGNTNVPLTQSAAMS